MDQDNYLKLLRDFKGDTMAADVWKSKYCAAELGEVSPRDEQLRLAKAFATEAAMMTKLSLHKYKQTFSPTGNVERNYDIAWWTEKILNEFLDYRYIIPQGSVAASLGRDVIASLSNCFVIGQPKDSYSGILTKDAELVQLMKRRGGVGLDISSLRPRGTVTNNAAKTSTGAVSFMGRYSNSTNEVAQDGRRGALMLTIHVNHPDVQEFITSKLEEGKITGANISVQLTNEFMNAVKNDTDYFLRWPCDLNLNKFTKEYYDAPYGELHYIEDHENNNEVCYVKKVKAKELFELIYTSAHSCADPGIMFLDAHWNNSPDGVYPQYRGITTNPCGEIFMQMYDACRLMALNFYSFVTNAFSSSAEVNTKYIRQKAYFMQILSDVLVSLEIKAIDKIISKIKDDENSDLIELNLWTSIREVASSGRRTGNGFTGLADMLAALNLPYDSSYALEVVDSVMESKLEGELGATIDLAKIYGPFKGWDKNLEYEFDENGTPIKGKNQTFQFWLEKYPELVGEMCKYGRRNVSFSTVAPVGSRALMAQGSSGIEPVYSILYNRRKKVNDNDTYARIDEVDADGIKWTHYTVLHPPFKTWLVKQHKRGSLDISSLDFLNLTREDIEPYVLASPWAGCQAEDIDWKKRIEMQAIVQKYTTHSISSTLNLASTVSPKLIGDIYLEAYNKGLKGVTVFRDGSKKGILSTNNHSLEDFDALNAIKRPTILPGHYHRVTIKGQPWTVIVGLLKGKPYEVFCFEGHSQIKAKEIDIKKIKRGEYHFISEKYTETIKGLNNPDQKALAKSISGQLRHRMHVKHVVELLNSSSSTIGDFPNVIARVLKKYIDEGETATGASCSNCNSTNLIYEEGCQKCQDCGTSKC